jgi:hypothetical protein
MKPDMSDRALVVVHAVEEDENTSEAFTKNISANRSKNF